MRPVAVRLVVALLAGVVITTLIAWRGVLVRRTHPTVAAVPAAQVPGHSARLFDEPPTGDQFDGSVASSPWLTQWRLRSNLELRSLNLAGWPMRCLRSEHHTSQPDAVTPTTSTFAGTWQLPAVLPLPPGPPHRVPVRPIWVGLAADVLFWGAIVWLLLASIQRLERRARLDRRHCPCCAYDLRAMVDAVTTVTCPECAEVIRATDLRRPRQVARTWMIPVLVPPLILAGLWFIGVLAWPSYGLELLWARQPTRWFLALCFLVIATLIGLIGLKAYADRPHPRGLLLAALAAAGLAALDVACLHVFNAWLSTTS